MSHVPNGKKIMEKKNQENKEILEKYPRIGPNKEMREEKIRWIRPKRKEEKREPKDEKKRMRKRKEERKRE